MSSTWMQKYTKEIFNKAPHNVFLLNALNLSILSHDYTSWAIRAYFNENGKSSNSGCSAYLFDIFTTICHFECD